MGAAESLTGGLWVLVLIQDYHGEQELSRGTMMVSMWILYGMDRVIGTPWVQMYSLFYSLLNKMLTFSCRLSWQPSAVQLLHIGCPEKLIF